MNNEEKDTKELENNESEKELDFFSQDPMARYKEKKTTKGTKKNIIFIICGVALVAALAGGVAAVVVNGVGKDTTETTEAETQDPDALTILEGEETNNVKTVELTNSEGTFEIYRSADAEGDEDAVFTLKGYEDYKQDSSIVKTIANNSVGLQTYQTVAEDVTDMDKYGLGDDAIKVSVTMDDGETASFKVGDKTADSSYEYFCLDGENTVYTVEISQVNNYSYGTDKFISSTIEEAIDDDSDFYVSYIDIARKDMDYDIVLDYDADLAEENDEEDDSSSSSTATVDMVMTEPVKCNLNAEKASDTTDCIFGLTAADIVKLAPEDADFKEYGLDDPDCTVTIKTSDNQEYVVKVGNEYSIPVDNGDDTEEATSATKYRYVYVEGADDIIYGIGEESLSWAYVEPLDISSKIIIDSYVWDIGTLKVEAPGHDTLNFVGTGSSKDDYVVTKNNESCDTERFRAFYAFLIKAYGEEFAIGEEPEGDPILTVTYKEQDGGKGKTISFYDDGSTKCLITIDGNTSFKCRKSFVEAVLSNIDIFDTDEDFATSWK